MQALEPAQKNKKHYAASLCFQFDLLMLDIVSQNCIFSRSGFTVFLFHCLIFFFALIKKSTVFFISPSDTNRGQKQSALVSNSSKVLHVKNEGC